MLSDIKKKSTGWVGNVIIALLALLVCLGGMQYYLTSSNQEAVVVTVDGHNITKRYLDKIYQINKVSLENGSDAAPLTQNELISLKQDLLEMLIDNQLKLNYASSNGMWVPTVIRDKYLYSQDIFKENDKFSVSKYQHIVNIVAGSEAAYLAQITNDLLEQQLVVGITNTAFVLPSEAKSIVQLINESRDVKYVRLSPDNLSNTAIKPSEITKYYNSHQEYFVDEAEVKVEYVILDNNNIAKNLSPNADQIAGFYQSNSNLFPNHKSVTYDMYTLTSSNDLVNVESIAKLQKLLENDNALATMLEQYISSHKQKIAISDSSTIKTLNIAEIANEEIKNRLMSMQPFDIALYENSGDLVLLQLKDVVLIPYNKLATNQQQLVLDSYIAKNTELKFTSLIEEITDLAYTEDNLTNIAKVAGAKINSSDYFTAARGDSLITKNETVRKMAFSDELIVDKMNSSAIKLDANKIVIFRVKNYLPATPQALVEASPEIIKILEKDTVKEALNLKADEIIKNTMNKQNTNIEWTTLNNIARVGIINRFGMEIRDDVFQMPIGSDAKPSLTKITLKNGDVVVIDVLSSSLPQKLKVTRSELEYQYANYWAKWNLYSFESGLRTEAEVKYTEKSDSKHA
jgi:peptidyl-prolyl cis-trans isomerase D